DQLVLENDVALADRDVAADLEGALVGLADASGARVLDEVGEAAREALALGLHRLLERLGIGGGEVRRAHRVDPLPRGKAQALLRLRLELGRLDQLLDVARSEQ